MGCPPFCGSFPRPFVPRGTKRRLQDRIYHIHVVYKCALAIKARVGAQARYPCAAPHLRPRPTPSSCGVWAAVVLLVVLVIGTLSRKMLLPILAGARLMLENCLVDSGGKIAAVVVEYKHQGHLR